MAAIKLSASASVSALSERPLVGGGTTPAFAVMDASAGATWGPFDLSLEIYNLLDNEYAALAYRYDSQWDPSPTASPSNAVHTVAASPLSWLLTLGLSI